MDLSLATLLVRPREAFATAGDSPSLVQPLTLVFLVGAASMATAFPLYVTLQRQLPPDITTLEFVIGTQTATLPLWFAVGIVAGIVIVFVGWLVTAVLLHGLARLAGGSGRFRRVFAFVGWSHAPYLVVYPLVALIALWQLTTTPGATLSGVLHGTRQFGEDTLATFNGQGLVDVSSLSSVVVTLWMGYIWLGGCEVVYDLTRRRAAVVAGVATALSLLLTQLPA